MTAPIADDMVTPGRSITGRTVVYAHLAHPSSHVRTPQVFNAAFGDRRIDAVAVSVDVEPHRLASMLEGLRGWRNLAGIGVTMPHKEAVAGLVDRITPTAELVGAVNVVRRETDGSLTGDNLDGLGFVAGLRRAGHDPAGAKALVVGVGGAGQAIAAALVDAGVASLDLANRSPERAERLARRLCDAHPAATITLGDPDPSGHDLVVNATPLGMYPGDDLPLRIDGLMAGTVVSDIIMAPALTPLLDEARRRGCVTHPGLPMLTAQVDLVIAFLGLRPCPSDG